MQYRRLEQLIELIEEPNLVPAKNLLTDHLVRFKAIKGAKYNHHAWQGGYYDHIQEVMNIAALLFPTLYAKRSLPFSLSDALLVLFLHDLEKPFSYYESKTDEWIYSAEKKNQDTLFDFKKQIIDRYHFFLSDDHINGIKYAHGELDDYRSDERVMQPLAAFCHTCDYLSARLWFDYPKEVNDPWDSTITRSSLTSSP